ncbi:MAG TPA: hypothetical protein VKS79_21280 [Gemmataceae bacterium]|nr:hypothetical protein [Gemmataceae bacterium]
MAGDWIKMRGGLMQSPKLIALARVLHRNQDFREWLTPGGSGPINGQIVSDDALRCVTCALLLRVWSASREYGKFEGDHLVLAHISIPDLDLMAGCPGVGKAMVAVGWAEVKDGDQDGVILPNFRQHNAPLTPAEKQSTYRDRAKRREQPADFVTNPLPGVGNKTVTREEKSREEREGGAPAPDKTPHPPPSSLAPSKKQAVGELFLEWGLRKGAGRPCSREELEAMFADLLDAGLTKEAILEGLAKPPKIEWPSEFMKRMRPRAGPAAGETVDQKAARIKAEREKRERDVAAAARPEEIRAKLRRAIGESR